MTIENMRSELENMKKYWENMRILLKKLKKKCALFLDLQTTIFKTVN